MFEKIKRFFKKSTKSANEIIEEMVIKTPKIKRLNSEQIIIYKNYLYHKYFNKKSDKSEPLREIQESWLSVLEILEDKKQHNFDIELSEEYIMEYAVKNNLEYNLARDMFIIDIVSDKEETKNVFYLAEKYQSNKSNPHPLTLLNPDEEVLYNRFKETNIIKSEKH
ncbi:hypothetical protein [Aliarcobacter butzleri]|uniref:hypothetical protein n=1 Tax=Aliarcobacter butzleri TaxID=28197 RepID=UPI002B24AD1C|nr:hypothetical protein [Aliarcobacter butzleri]